MNLTQKRRTEIAKSTGAAVYEVVRRCLGHVLAITATKEDAEAERDRIHAKGRGYTYAIDIRKVRA